MALDDSFYYPHKDGGFCIMAHGGGGADAAYEVSLQCPPRTDFLSTNLQRGFEQTSATGIRSSAFLLLLLQNLRFADLGG